MSTVRLKSREISYPESDGKPMAETDVHRDGMVSIIERLRWRFRGQRVYVSGNLFIYYEEGDSSKSLAPDVFVVLDCDPRRRRPFKTWEEGKGPDFAFETTSAKTRREDQGPKKKRYAQIKVPELFLYDPLGDWLNPPLQGFRLVHGDYERIAPEPDGSIVSRTLNIRFTLQDGELVMLDLGTGERLLDDAERAWEERTRAEEEKHRAEQERDRAEQEKNRAEKEKDRAEQEKRRAEAAERRLAEEEAARTKLEQELARLKKKRPKGGSA
jgi:Uma2 family endonuclease